MDEAPSSYDPMLDRPLGPGLRLYTLVMTLLLLFAHGSAYAEPPPGAGTLFLGLPGQAQPATQVATEVNIRIAGFIAEVSVSQTFRNDGAGWTEGRYVFPLPEDAAVNSLRLRLGERIIEGEIREREAARAVYTAATQAGQRAGLVEQERPNLFSTSVANIGPGQEIRVEIDYVQTLRYDSGEFRLRFPMTFTPRYIPGRPLPAEVSYQAGAGGWATPTDAVADAGRITPPMQHPLGGPLNPTQLQVELTPGFELARLQSLYHPIAQARSGERHSLRVLTERSDRDFVLVWAPEPAQTPQAAVFTEQVDGEAYALLMLLPPQIGGERLPRELVFVIDTSGSMAGDSIHQAKAALLLALERLGPADHFNVIQFNSQAEALFTASVPAMPAALGQAKAYVQRLSANGGTEMSAALRLALSAVAGEEERLRQVVFITDGAVGNEAELFGQIQRELGAARLFTVGIGSAPNGYFMRKAAGFGRGSFTYIGRLDEVGTRMGELFAKLESPLLRDLCVRWPGVAEAYPEKLPDLYAGEPLVLTARLPALAGEVEVCGETAGQSWRRRLVLAPEHTHPGVATLWARRKIGALMDRKHAGAGEAQIREQVLAVALRHRLASAYTSFVAIDRTPVRPATAPLHSEALAHNLPAGTQPEGFAQVALPSTATPAPALLAGGSAALLLALTLFGLARRRPA
jgi:Ca-activated chloride channel family protein